MSKKEELKKCNWRQKFVKTFFYNEERTELSRTAMMNFIYFLCSVTIIVIAVIAGLCCNKTLDSNLFLYVGGLTGGGFLQYSYSKTLGRRGERKK